jgi:threonine synthase
MDILVSSNLARLLYLMSGDTGLVADLMAKLNKDGIYTVPEDLLAEIQSQFWAGWSDDKRNAATIGKVWQEKQYLCDTHTASGWAVAEDYVNQTGDKRPMVVLSTASPYKFPAAVLEAIDGNTDGDEFTLMERLQEITAVPIPGNLSGLRQKPERHTGVIGKDEMLDFVLGL